MSSFFLIPRSSFLKFLFFLCPVIIWGHLQNTPSYEEYLRLAVAAGVSTQSSYNSNNNMTLGNFQGPNSPFHDEKGVNYLEYLSPQKIPVLNPQNLNDPDVMQKIRKLSKFDICKMLRPNVSLKCCSNIQRIFNAVKNHEEWALEMVDAFGKPASGILLGNFFYPGAYDECLSTKVPSDYRQPQNNSFQPKYCFVNLPVEKSPLVTMKYGLCSPDSCEPNEINFIFHKAIQMLPVKIPLHQTSFVTCPQKKDYDAKAIFSLVFCSVFLLILLLATFYDILFLQLGFHPKFKTVQILNDIMFNKSQSSFDETINDDCKKPILTEDKEQSLFEKLLLCFSVRKNAAKLFKTDLAKESLTSIHGIRFISMTWVILGHTYVFGLPVWSNSKIAADLFSRFTFQAVGNATVSVDTFFLLSGLLVVYSVMHTMDANDGKINWFYYYFHRFWRLTPPYMLVMMVYIPLFQYWGDGPYWPINGIEKDYCRNTWWYNLLYINNFNDQECMAWSWYLANDMQFYVISPIILIFLYKKPKIGFGILSVLMLAQLITCGTIMKVKQYGGLLSPGYFNEVYVKPYMRIGSYLVGMVYGYLLYKYRKITINGYIVTLLWLFATICALSVLYGLYDSYNGSPLSADVNALYTTVNRIVWAISVGWVVYACVTGYGGFVNSLLSMKILIPLSRLTYCAYLVHPIVMESFYLNTRYPIYLTDFETIYLFFGHLMMSYLVAFVVSMAFEAPMIALESLIRGKK